MAWLRPVAGSTETSRSRTVVQSRPAPNATLSARPPPSAAAPGASTSTSATQIAGTNRMSRLRPPARTGSLLLGLPPAHELLGLPEDHPSEPLAEPCEE